MLWKDQLNFVLQHMKKNKLRVTMTVLAATIGCAFLIVLASVGFGMQKTMENEILNDEKVTQISLWSDEKTLTADEREYITDLKHVNSVLDHISINSGVNAIFEDRKLSTFARAFDMKELGKLPTRLSEGKLPRNVNEIVVGYHFAQGLVNEADVKEIERKNKEAEQNGTWYDGAEEGYKGSILGKKVQLQLDLDDDGEKTTKAETYTIVGISAKPTYEWDIDNSVMFSSDILKAYPALPVNTETRIYVDTMDNVMPVLDTLKKEGYQVYSQMEQMDEIEMVFLIIKIALVFVGTIAILIASIGIFNTMTMAVTERTREIGVLKAIGSSPALIQRLFVMESAFIGILGTVLAIIIAYIISISTNLLLPIIIEMFMPDSGLENVVFTDIPVSLVLIASAISIGVALFSGWRPARKATKIEVIQALRQEL